MAAWKVIVMLSRLGLVLVVCLGGITLFEHEGRAADIVLPAPSHSNPMSVETALQERRSIRAYRNAPMSLAEVSQLLWAAQGITTPHGYRTAPSAGALYPLEVYLVAGHVRGLPAGLYKYRPLSHTLGSITEGDLRAQLASAALGQRAVGNGAIVIVITAVYGRTTAKYGKRGVRYVHMEVGHAAQNVYLQAMTLGLGTVFIGAFSDDRVKDTLKIPDEERPLGIMPVGRPR